MIGAITAIVASMGLSSGSGYVFWSLVTTHLSAIAVGQATSLVAAFSAISLFVGQPIGVTLVTRLPRSPHRWSLLNTALRVTALRGALVSSVVILVLPHASTRFAFANHPVTEALFVAAATTQAVGLVSDQASIGIRFARIMSQRSVAQGVLKLGLFSLQLTVAGTIHRGPDIVLAVWTTANLMSTSWAIVVCRKRCPGESTRVSGTALRRELSKRSIWQNVTSLCGSLPPQIMPLMVAAQMGATASGEFSLTWNVGAACYVISPAVASALLAELSDEGASSRRRIGMASLIVVGLLVPMDIFLVSCGSFVLRYFGRNVATAGHDLLFILVLATFPDAVTNIAVSVYRSRGELMRAAMVNMTIAAVVLGSISFLVSRQQISGAGYAWLAGEMAGTLLLPLIQPLTFLERRWSSESI